MRQGLEAYYQGNKYDKYYWTAVFMFHLLACLFAGLDLNLPHNNYTRIGALNYTTYYSRNLINFLRFL